MGKRGSYGTSGQIYSVMQISSKIQVSREFSEKRPQLSQLGPIPANFILMHSQYRGVHFNIRFEEIAPGVRFLGGCQSHSKRDSATSICQERNRQAVENSRNASRKRQPDTEPLKTPQTTLPQKIPFLRNFRGESNSTISPQVQVPQNVSSYPAKKFLIDLTTFLPPRFPVPEFGKSGGVISR